MAVNNLSTIPPIIEYLESRGDVTPDQAAAVRDALDKNDYPGKFAGDIAVSMGFVTRRRVNEHLADRALMRALAAVEDLRALRDHGEIELENWQVPHLGNNNKVNPIRTELTKADGAVIASNFARLICLLAAQQPEKKLAGEYEVFEGALAAKTMAEGLIFGHSSVAPIKHKADDWLDLMEAGLRKASIVLEQAKRDQIGTYIYNRFEELRQLLTEID